MKPFTIEETIDLSKKGWNVGTTLYGSPFMQWLHNFSPPAQLELLTREIKRQEYAEVLRDLNPERFKDERYLEAIKKWPLKEKYE